MKTPTLIYEPANFHAGDAGQLTRLIDALAGQAYPARGIKFHPISADKLALPDYKYAEVYRRIEIDHATWGQIIAHAAAALGPVWIECADANCVEVALENRDKLAGVKLQASILANDEVLDGLRALDLSAKTVMLNISGYQLDAIQAGIDRFAELSPAKIALQVGFQAYPTRIGDTQLNKIAVLRAAFPDCEIALADHVDANDPFARRVPLLALALGCEIIEKHVCLDRAATDTDRFSALEPAEIGEMQRDLELAAAAFGRSFIAPAEAEYLKSTLQRPVLKRPLEAGQMVSGGDLLYRRTNEIGLTREEIEARQAGGEVLAGRVEASRVLTGEDFRRAGVAAIMAGRLKSTRLPRKALLPVHGVPSVERTLENCLRIPGVDRVVFATSTNAEDDELVGHDLDGRVDTWRGDPEDVIDRYLGACDQWGIDVVIRTTADCLTVSPEVCGALLRAHFAAGADYTRANRETPGAAPQIFNVEALRRIRTLSGGAIHSEYMNQYVENNPEHFKINWVDMPDDYIRPYRLTLDYPEDLAMYEALYAELARRGVDADLVNVLAVLDEHPEIAALNVDIGQIYLQDPDLLARLKRVTRFPEASSPAD